MCNEEHIRGAASAQLRDSEAAVTVTTTSDIDFELAQISEDVISEVGNTDPMAMIKIFCQLPYLANGKTDSIARTVMEAYVSRLTHEKYAATYHKVVNSLKTMFHARPGRAGGRRF